MPNTYFAVSILALITASLPLDALAFPLTKRLSLAGEFLIHLQHGQADGRSNEVVDQLPKHSCSFSLFPLTKDDSDTQIDSDPFVARQSLDAAHRKPPSDAYDVITAAYSEKESCLKISIVSNDATSSLMQVLAKVIAHHWLLSYSEVLQLDLNKVSIHLPDQTSIWLTGVNCVDDKLPLRMFGLDDSKGSDAVEMVEIVHMDGTMIGAVPRPFVHQHNLLHRGIGLFVTKGVPIRTDPAAKQPDLYVHQRTASKRIFPALYDMFVGGVSGFNEAPLDTARREVAEELGLKRSVALSGPILQCIVCTAYNRCVVDLFCYTAEPEETIQWQDEEVSWGDYVPYEVVEAAADRSIQRCEPWPGSPERYQSPRKGQLDGVLGHSDEEWKHWDFVPDGLLVWEAWARYLEERK